MAADTKTKRLSIMCLGLSWMRPPPVPDGTIEFGDRLHLMGMYSGQTAPEAVTGAGLAGALMFMRVAEEEEQTP